MGKRRNTAKGGARASSEDSEAARQAEESKGRGAHPDDFKRPHGWSPNARGPAVPVLAAWTGNPDD